MERATQRSNFKHSLKFIDMLCCLIFTNELMSHLCHHCVTHVVLLCTGDGIIDSVPLCHFSSLPFNFVVFLENESSINAWPMVAR